MIRLSIILLLGVSTLFSGCKKEEGEGGRASIKGKIYARYYNNAFTVLLSQGYVTEEDVYIIYGDNPSSGNRTRTSYDGSFEFNYLQKGKYRILVYSKDSTLQAIPNKIPVLADVEITERKQVVALQDIVVFK
jgi:hypothetical protein